MSKATPKKRSKQDMRQALIDSKADKIFIKFLDEVEHAPSSNVQGMRGMPKPKLLWQVRSDFVERAKDLNKLAASLGLKAPFDPNYLNEQEANATEPGMFDD